MKFLTNNLITFFSKRFQSRPWLIILFSRFHKWVYLQTNGKILGTLGGLPVFILSSQGRKTGKIIETVLIYYFDEGKYFIVASFGGNQNHPSWYLNLKKNPQTTFQVGQKRFDCYARVLSRKEKSCIWPEITKFYTGYGRYQQSTKREIPVLELELR